jgi:scavenger receptor class B protein 1
MKYEMFATSNKLHFKIYNLITINYLIQEDHMIIIDIDPFTGSPVYARTRVQLNLLINPVEKINQMKNLREMLLPIIWIDEILILPDFLIKEIKFGYTLVKIGQ